MDEDAYDVAVTFAKADEFLAVKGMHVKGGKVDMCKALKEMLEDERMEGIEQGLKVLIEEYKEFGISKDEVSVRLKQKFTVSEEVIQRAIDNYF